MRNKNVNLVLSISAQPETYKFTRKDYAPKVLTLSEFVHHIELNYHWSPVYKSNSLCVSKKDFISSSAIPFIVRTELPMEEYIIEMYKKKYPLPTITYRLENDRYGLHRYVLVYCFDKSLYRKEFEKMHQAIVEAINLDLEKNPGNYVGETLINRHKGAAYPTVYWDYLIYSQDDFRQKKSKDKIPF